VWLVTKSYPVGSVMLCDAIGGGIGDTVLLVLAVVMCTVHRHYTLQVV